MKNWAMTMAAIAGTSAMSLVAGVHDASAGTSHWLYTAPGPMLLNKEGPGGPSCIVTNVYGGVQLGSFSCAFIGGGTGWSPWNGGDINLPWGPNPSSGNSAVWNATVPVNTEFRARVAFLDENGAVVSIGPFVSGGGQRLSGADVGGFGAMILNFQMRTYRSSLSSPVPTPVLHTVAALVYAQ